MVPFVKFPWALNLLKKLNKIIQIYGRRLRLILIEYWLILHLSFIWNTLQKKKSKEKNKGWIEIKEHQNLASLLFSIYAFHALLNTIFYVNQICLICWNCIIHITSFSIAFFYLIFSLFLCVSCLLFVSVLITCFFLSLHILQALHAEEVLRLTIPIIL